MALSRAYEENEVGPELRRIYAELRTNFDLPFVPTVLKSLAAVPPYLKGMWRDLGPVVDSREFHAASAALNDFVRAQAIGSGWRLRDQERMLAEQKISTNDMPVLAGVVGIFVRTLPSLLLFARLMQCGYQGGQKGRVSAGKQAPALSRLVTLHVPNEREASLRVWLIYADIRRTLKTKNVMSLYRALSPFPSYLASAWGDSKSVLADKSFQRASEEISQRAAALLRGIPVRDHGEIFNSLSPEQAREVRETVDEFARTLPSLALLTVVWRRSFYDAKDRKAA
jgi:Halocarboxylic acid dehydrogenase DehI